MKTSLADYTEWLTYHEDALDTSKSLWFVRDVLDVSALHENAVCLAADNFSVLIRCKPFFKAFPSVFIALADNELRTVVAEAFEEYLPEVLVLLPDDKAFKAHKNIREVHEAGGSVAVDRLIAGASERPMRGLLDLARVEKETPENIPSVLSGFDVLDGVTGGFYGSELSVWTGKSGGGKSSILGQILVEAIHQGHKVCAYSGELSAWRFKQWVSLQAAGPDNITEKEDRFSGYQFFVVNPLAQDRIDNWWGGRFFLTDNTMPDSSSEDEIIALFEYAVRRHGCSVFLVDNMMTARFSATHDSDYYRSQSTFVGRLIEFAKRYEVHVHLVAHPRKTDADRRLSAEDIAGSADIRNRCDNLFSLERLSEDAAAAKGFDTVLRVLKNRNCGKEISIGLCFDRASRRFFKPGTAPNKSYGWEQIVQQTAISLPEREDGNPF